MTPPVLADGAPDAGPSVDVVQSRVARSGRHEPPPPIDVSTSRMSRDEFASLVAHELRNPINAMSGWLHLLSADEALRSDASRRALAGVRRALDEQLVQVDTLASVLRMGDAGRQATLQPTDLDTLVDDVAQKMASTARAAGRDVVVGHDARRGQSVPADRDAVLEALGALGVYGLRHGMAGAPLEIRLQRDAEGPVITLGIDEGREGRSIWHGFEQRGGRLPLTLLHATLVLEAHGARVAPSGEGRAGDVLEIRFGGLAAADRHERSVSGDRPRS